MARWTFWFAAFSLMIAAMAAGTGNASAETRSLKIYHLHTGEKAEIVFKRNGVYDQEGLRKLNVILRDWRRNQPIRMDPRLFDLIWETYRAVGATQYISVVCGYRAPETNSMLRSRSRGVAEKSQHMLGKAMDFFIPGIGLKTLRETAMKEQGGGVGYYPTSGSPFVHLDVGNVRHWPKMSRSELVRLFPRGGTLHIPSDGKPLPGFQEALASYQSRKSNGQTAIALAGPVGGSTKRMGGLLSAFFGGGGGDDEQDDSADVKSAPVFRPVSPRAADTAVPAASRAIARAAPALQKAAPPSEPVETAAEQPKPKALIPGIQIVSPDQADRVEILSTPPKALVPGIQVVPPDQANRIDVPSAEPEETPRETPESIIAALPARSIPMPGFAPRPKVEQATAEIQTASVDVGAPADLPFGKAQEETAVAMASDSVAASAQVLAAHAPRPTPRPDGDRLKPAAVAALPENPVPNQQAVMMALVEPDKRPAAFTDDGMPVPSNRPDIEALLASLPETGPMLDPSPTSMTPPVTDADRKAAIVAARKASGERVAALAAASARPEQLQRVINDDNTPPVLVRTTRKSGRAVSAARIDRRSVIVMAAPNAAAWVKKAEKAKAGKRDKSAPSIAYNAVVTAPREVYTSGFSTRDQAPDPRRFTGKSVQFLSVARFQ